MSWHEIGAEICGHPDFPTGLMWNLYTLRARARLRFASSSAALDYNLFRHGQLGFGDGGTRPEWLAFRRLPSSRPAVRRLSPGTDPAPSCG